MNSEMGLSSKLRRLMALVKRLRDGPRGARHGARLNGPAIRQGEDVRFACDSPLEGAVTSELVSESEIPGGSQK
jgi:hypothetical protein